MTKPIELPSAEDLRELFGYDVLRGELFWRESPNSKVKAGSVAGNLRKDGYRQVRINGKNYYAHRLIWQWVYGAKPSADLDHAGQEGITPKRNHVWGLQEVTAREHITITKAHHKTSNLPVGVRLVRRRYQAEIDQDGKKVYLGRYNTPEEAHQAYLGALGIIKSGGKVVSAARPRSSRYKGVCWRKEDRKWMAQTAIDGKRKYLGVFLTEIEAHQAVCKALR